MKSLCRLYRICKLHLTSVLVGGVRRHFEVYHLLLFRLSYILLISLVCIYFSHGAGGYALMLTLENLI
jgi:hypothetical protein